MFTRRQVIAGAIAAGAAAPLAAWAQQPVVDGPRLNWRIGVWGRPRVNTSHAEALKRVVEARTGGKWTVTLGYEQFGGAKELPDLVKVGAIHGAWVYPAYYPDRMPVFGILDLPFLPIENIDGLIRAHEALAKHPAAVAEAARWGGTMLMGGPLPPYEVMGRGKPPLKLGDWKGLRVRAPGGTGDALARLGAVPTSGDSTEAYTSLERGVIDGVAFPSTVSFASFKIYEIASWMTENLAVGAGSGPLLVNSEAIAQLPPQYAALLEEVRAAGYDDFRRGYKEVDDKNIPMFKARGMRFIRYDEGDLAEFRKLGGEPVWNDWVTKMAAQGLPARELLDLVLNTLRGGASKS